MSIFQDASFGARKHFHLPVHIDDSSRDIGNSHGVSSRKYVGKSFSFLTRRISKLLRERTQSTLTFRCFLLTAGVFFPFVSTACAMWLCSSCCRQGGEKPSGKHLHECNFTCALHSRRCLWMWCWSLHLQPKNLTELSGECCECLGDFFPLFVPSLL